MNIGIFTNIYLPGVSGVITAIENYRKELERQGHQVFIFAAKYPGYQDRESNIFRFKSIDLRYKISYPLPVISSPRLSRTIKKLKLDIIHSQHFFICGQIAWYYAKKFNIPLIFTHHTRYDLSIDYVPILPKELSKSLAQILCAFYSDSCDAVIAPTQDVKELLLKYKVKTPIAVIPSGINLREFTDLNFQIASAKSSQNTCAEHCQAMREKYNIGEDKILLLSTSRLGPEKNLLFLLKSFKKINSKYPNTYFMLVGDGPSKKMLESQSAKLGLKERVIFTGEISRQKIPLYYAAADIFLFSSLSDVQPTVITEAMASGLPIVAVKANGAKDVIINKENGVLTSHNISDFSQAVIKLINRPDWRKKISGKAQKTANNYSIEKSTKKLIALYEKTKNGKQRRNKNKIIELIKFKQGRFTQIFNNSNNIFQ